MVHKNAEKRQTRDDIGDQKQKPSGITCQKLISATSFDKEKHNIQMILVVLCNAFSTFSQNFSQPWKVHNMI